MEDKLKFINRVNLLVFATLLLLALPFLSLNVYFGLILGAGIIVLNFFALQAIVRRMFAAQGGLKKSVLGLYVLKFFRPLFGGRPDHALCSGR